MARILSIEDNEDNQELLLMIFETSEHELSTVSTAEAGLDRIRAGGVDLVIMDINLPGMQGDEATRVLRSDSRFRDLPIIALTAHALTNEIDAIMASGVDVVLTKPLDEDEPLASVERLLRGAASRGR